MSEPDPADAPTGLAAVWAARSRAESEPKQGLSLRRVVEAAIAVADADGLAAVSMSRVAKHLGFTTMALYRHVRSKEELTLFMQDTAIGPPPDLAGGPGDGWRGGLERWARAVLARFDAHPWIAQTIPLAGAPFTPHQVAWLDRGLSCLGATALTEAEKLSTVLLVDAYVLGYLQFAPSEQPIVALAPESYGPVLAGVLDAQEHPALMRAVAAGAFDAEPGGPAGDAIDDAGRLFAFGLARVLDGVEVLVRRRAGDPGAG